MDNIDPRGVRGGTALFFFVGKSVFEKHPNLGHVWGIIWGMSGACLGQHLGHIVNNGQQSAVLHASVMLFFKTKIILITKVRGKRKGLLDFVTAIMN